MVSNWIPEPKTFPTGTLREIFLRAVEPMSPEQLARVAQLPPELQKVVNEFLADIELAQTNLKTCIVDGFYWLQYARDQLCFLLSYLRTEQLRDELRSEQKPPGSEKSL